MEVIEEIPKPNGVQERSVRIPLKNPNWTPLCRIFANLSECPCVIPTFPTSTWVPICPGILSNLKRSMVKKFLWRLRRRESRITMTTPVAVPVVISHRRYPRKSGNPLKIRISLKINNQERSQPMITYSYPIFQHSRWVKKISSNWSMILLS